MVNIGQVILEISGMKRRTAPWISSVVGMSVTEIREQRNARRWSAVTTQARGNATGRVHNGANCSAIHKY